MNRSSSKQRLLHCLLSGKWECEMCSAPSALMNAELLPITIFDIYVCGCGKKKCKDIFVPNWVCIHTSLLCIPYQPASRPTGRPAAVYTSTHWPNYMSFIEAQTNIGMLGKGWCTAHVCPHHQPSIEVGQEGVNWPCWCRTLKWGLLFFLLSFRVWLVRWRTKSWHINKRQTLGQCLTCVCVCVFYYLVCQSKIQ